MERKKKEFSILEPLIFPSGQFSWKTLKKIKFWSELNPFVLVFHA